MHCFGGPADWSANIFWDGSTAQCAQDYPVLMVLRWLCPYVVDWGFACNCHLTHGYDNFVFYQELLEVYAHAMEIWFMIWCLSFLHWVHRTTPQKLSRNYPAHSSSPGGYPQVKSWFGILCLNNPISSQAPEYLSLGFSKRDPSRNFHRFIQQLLQISLVCWKPQRSVGLLWYCTSPFGKGKVVRNLARIRLLALQLHDFETFRALPRLESIRVSWAVKRCWKPWH